MKSFLYSMNRLCFLTLPVAAYIGGGWSAVMYLVIGATSCAMFLDTNRTLKEVRGESR